MPPLKLFKQFSILFLYELHNINVDCFKFYFFIVCSVIIENIKDNFFEFCMLKAQEACIKR